MNTIVHFFLSEGIQYVVKSSDSRRVEVKMMLMAIIIVVLLANIHTVTAFTCFCRVQQAYHKLYSSIKDDNEILCSSDP